MERILRFSHVQNSLFEAIHNSLKLNRDNRSALHGVMSGIELLRSRC